MFTFSVSFLGLDITIFFFFFKKIKVELTYNVVLIVAVVQSVSYV